MNTISDILKTNALFKDMDSKYITKLLSCIHYQVQSFKKGFLIASEGDRCSCMGFVLKGQIDVHKPNASGSTVLVNSLKPGDSFGNALVFSDTHEYPSTIITAKDSSVLLISSADILGLCEKDPIFLKNLIKNLSNRIIYLNRKVKMLSQRTIRQKLSCYLLEESRKQKSLALKCRHTRSEIADLIGTSRPSVSRELSKMENLGIIRVKLKNINILNNSLLEDMIK